MKFLFVIGDLSSGGAQRQVLTLAMEIVKLGHEVEFAVYLERDYYGEVLRQNNIQITKLIAKNPAKRILTFRKYIRGNEFDIVVSFLGVPNFICELAALPLRRWKLIVNERSADPVILRSLNSRFRRLFHVFADTIVCNSYANKLIVQKVNPLLRDDKIEVLYNMIDLDIWKPLKNFEYSKNDVLHLLIAASHRKLKNMLGLLQGVTLLNEEERSKLKISWYGDNLTPPYYDDSIVKCKQFIEKYNLKRTIDLYPADHYIRDKMQRADVIGLFSFFEGLPNSICEGMALGKPILASAVSDIPLLIRDGVNGKLCDPRNIQTISDALRYFINADKKELKKMGDLNRKKATMLFDLNRNVKKYLEFII